MNIKATPTAVLTAALAFLSGCAEQPPRRQAILILLDAARPDRMSCYGYERATTPHLAELAGRGVVFENNYAHGTSTRATVPCLLYSRYFTVPLFPGSSSVPFAEPENLFRTADSECLSLPRALAGAGLTTAALSAHTWLKEGTQFAREFQHMVDLSATTEYEKRYAYPRAEQVVDHAIAWLEDHLGEDYFLYLHLMDTHFPHFHEGAATEYFAEDGLEASVTFHPDGRPRNLNQALTPAEKRYLDALYDGSMNYTDGQLGRLFDFLAGKGTLEQTVIAVTADHGEYLMEQPGRFEHGGEWRDLVARTPMIVAGPGLRPGRYRSLTEAVDALPTFLDLLDIKPAAGHRPDGVSLAAQYRGEVPPKDYAWAPKAIRSERYKALFEGGARSGTAFARGLLYDLAQDPDEVDNRWDHLPAIAEVLAAAYRERAHPLYERFVNSRTNQQPQSSFALATRMFELSPEPGTVPPVRRGEPLAESGPDWLQCRHWNQFWLLARRSAEPLEMKVAVPDGEYLVKLGMGGACTVTVEDHEPVRLQARAVPPENPYAAVNVDCGVITVSGQTFRVVVTPDTSESPFLLRQIGFEPVLADGSVASEDPAYLERLKALGYVDGG